MTAPAPTWSYPTWWTDGVDGYPNVENLLKTLFVPQLPGLTVTYWMPPEDQIQAILLAGGGILRIYRTGGSIDHDNNVDLPKVQIAALTRSRDASWGLIEFVRTGVLESFRPRAAVVPGTIHKLKCDGEVVGPQIIPELMRDERLVPATFALQTWRTNEQSYRQALGL